VVSGSPRLPEPTVTDRPLSASPLLFLLYPLGLLIFADQVTDVLALLMAQPAVETGSAQWRFITFGLVTSRITALVLADVMILGAAVLLQHRIMLRVMGFLHLLVAITLAVTLVLFLLDALELRSLMRFDDRQRLVAAASRTFVVTSLAILACAAAGILALRATRSSRHRRGHKSGPLVVSADDAR
jgi:hypothetical protein